MSIVSPECDDIGANLYENNAWSITIFVHPKAFFNMMLIPVVMCEFIVKNSIDNFKLIFLIDIICQKSTN